MNKNMDSTVQFEGINDKKMTVAETILHVCNAMEEKGYNPINQIIGYLLSGDSSYVTSHKNARSLIKKFERDEILEEVMKKYLNIEE